LTFIGAGFFVYIVIFILIFVLVLIFILIYVLVAVFVNVGTLEDGLGRNRDP
jgi:hypothetical protein